MREIVLAWQKTRQANDSLLEYLKREHPGIYLEIGNALSSNGGRGSPFETAITYKIIARMCGGNCSAGPEGITIYSSDDEADIIPVAFSSDLWIVDDTPDFWLKYGFTRNDEPTTDNVRWVRYEKAFSHDRSQVRLVLLVEYQLSISDNPNVPTNENYEYSFEGVYLKIVDRRMEREGNLPYDEDTERPRIIDKYQMDIETADKVFELAEMLSKKPEY